MSDIVGVITSVEDDSYDNKDFKVVTLGTGQILKVKQGREGKLKAKWGLLQVGVGMKFTMTDFTKPDGVKIPFVSDIETVEGALPPPVTPELPAEQQKKIDEALEHKPEVAISPQEKGMFYKEIGEMYRAGKLEGTTGKALMTAYWARMFTVVGIEKEKPKPPPPPEPKEFDTIDIPLRR